VVKGGGFSAKYALRFISHVLRFIVLEPIRLLELIFFYRKISNHELTEDPIFVLGHWRSGTSHLQTLLRLDPRTTSIGIFSSIFSGNFLLTSSTIKPIAQGICKLFRIEYSIQRTPLDLDYPGEMDTALCFLPNSHSYTWGHVFPSRFKKHLDMSVFNDDPKSTSNWLNDYDHLIKKVSLFSKRKRVVVKSPGDTGRLKFLLERYPNAKFVYIHREHEAVYHSNLFLWNIIRNRFSLQYLSDELIHENIIYTYPRLLKRYNEDRELLGENQLVEISFKELRIEPLQVLEKIYSNLELGELPIDIVKPHLKTNEAYRTNTYETPSRISEELEREWKEVLRFNPRKI
jgi:hypothetical protein